MALEGLERREAQTGTAGRGDDGGGMAREMPGSLYIAY